MTEQSLEIPLYDARATRSAIRRGILRTAISTAVTLWLLYFLLLTLSGLWQTHGSRRHRLQDVVGAAFMVANPGYSGNVWSCCNVHLTSIGLQGTLEPRTAGALRPPINVDLRIGLRGRLDLGSLPRLPTTPLDLALADRPPIKAATGALLDRLPRGLVASAVVELATPLADDAWRAFLLRHGRVFGVNFLDVPPIFLQRPYANRSGLVKPLVWPEPQLAVRPDLHPGVRAPDDDSLRQFHDWSRRLRGGDGHNLAVLRLPGVEEIRRAGARPRVYGFILSRASRSQLERYLVDPQVGRISLGDVAFDLRTR